MPASLNKDMLRVILKDCYGDHSSTENVRPITVSDSIALIYENYFKIILRNIPIDSNQMGFKSRASTSHAIFTFREGQRYINGKL